MSKASQQQRGWIGVHIKVVWFQACAFKQASLRPRGGNRRCVGHHGQKPALWSQAVHLQDSEEIILIHQVWTNIFIIAWCILTRHAPPWTLQSLGGWPRDSTECPRTLWIHLTQLLPLVPLCWYKIHFQSLDNDSSCTPMQTIAQKNAPLKC